jgi:hypothetical protein
MFEQEDKKIIPAAPPTPPPVPPGTAGKSAVPVPPGTPVKPAAGAKTAPAFVIPEIHAMPEKLIGAPAGRAPVVREVVVTREQKIQAPPPPPPPRPAPKKRGNLFLVIALVVVLLGVGVAAVILFVPLGKPVPVANLNANVPPPVNVNVPPPVNENSNENENANVNVPPPPPPPPRSGPDSDSDGLTDVEETTIYMTDPKNPDTDGDSFNDGNEVVHLFDPAIKQPALLKDSPHVRVVVNSAEGYTALTPATWTERGAGTDQYFVDAPSGEFIEILATPKPADQSIMDWYLATSPDAKATDVTGFKSYKGLNGLRSSDRLTAYLDAGDKVLTVTYNPNGMTDYNFISTEEMVIASIDLVKP